MASDCILEAHGLGRTFRTEAEELVILKDLELSVQAGESLAILGASGSGKSTLLSLLGGLDRPDSGTLRAGLWRLDLLEERKLPAYRGTFVGFVFQFHYLIKDFTALENVTLPALMRGTEARQARERARALLDSLGLGERLNHLPGKLSGGERQRVALARALINSPALLLADEPTGSLDPDTALRVMDLLFEVPGRHGAALVVATHDANLAARADRRMALVGGRLEPA